jgi:hypothetical protein
MRLADPAAGELVPQDPLLGVAAQALEHEGGGVEAPSLS